MPDIWCLVATTQGYPNSIKGQWRISLNGREEGIFLGVFSFYLVMVVRGGGEGVSKKLFQLS